LHRADLSYDEKGKSLISIMQNKKVNLDELAKMTGLSTKHISDVIKFANLDNDIKESDVPESNIMEVVNAVHSKSSQKNLLKKIEREGWGREKIRRAARVVQQSPEDVTRAILKDEITPEQGESISKFKDKNLRQKAIQEHKNLKIVDKDVKKNIERQLTNAEKRKQDKKLIQARNVIATFRATSVECSKLVQRTIKALILANSFANVLDEVQADKLKHYIELWEATMSNAIKLAEQVEEKI
jgi:hypothetical protein